MNIHVQFGFNHICSFCAGHRLTLDLKGKCSNAFFSETTNMIKAKLHECSLDGPLHTLLFLFRYDIQNNVNLCIAVVAILDFRST
jgi:hypothetical protein